MPLGGIGCQRQAARDDRRDTRLVRDMLNLGHDLEHVVDEIAVDQKRGVLQHLHLPSGRGCGRDSGGLALGRIRRATDAPCGGVVRAGTLLHDMGDLVCHDLAGGLSIGEHDTVAQRGGAHAVGCEPRRVGMSGRDTDQRRAEGAPMSRRYGRGRVDADRITASPRCSPASTVDAGRRRRVGIVMGPPR